MAIFENFVPLIAVIMAYFILGEQLRHYKIVQLIFAFFGASMLILATPDTEEELNEEEEIITGKESIGMKTILRYSLLILNPLMIAYGQVLMR